MPTVNTDAAAKAANLRDRFELAYATAWHAAREKDGTSIAELAETVKIWRNGDSYDDDLPRLRFGWEGFQWAGQPALEASPETEATAKCLHQVVEEDRLELVAAAGLLSGHGHPGCAAAVLHVLDKIAAQPAQAQVSHKECRTNVSKALGFDGTTNYAWSYLLGQIEELVKCEEELVAIKRAAALAQAVAVPEVACAEVDWDQLPEDAGERAMFDRNLDLYGGDPRVVIATSLRLWANTRSTGSFGLMCAVFANEVAKMRLAAPAQGQHADDAAVDALDATAKRMAERLMGWKLPQDFAPDCYIHFDRDKAMTNNSWPIGTNLLTVGQAEKMFDYVLNEAAPQAQEDAAALEAPAAPEWERVRRGLSMMMMGFASTPGKPLQAAEAALDAATEPGMPLACLRALAAAPQAPAAPVDLGVVFDMVALVKRLVREHRSAEPNSLIASQALDYLKRHGLLDSPLRVHSDDAALDRFALAMRAKLAAARAKGLGGWETCPPEALNRMLHEHLDKGDPRDVANFCFFLWHTGHRTTMPREAIDAAHAAQGVPSHERE